MFVLTARIAACLREVGHEAYVLNNSGGEEFDRVAVGPRPGLRKRLLWMGRPDDAKGFPVAVATFRLLRKSDSAWSFDVYGSDGKGLPSELGMAYHGFVRGDAKVGAFQQGGIFILPSAYANETQPLSIIEALASGLPVVASDVGGIREMVESNGWRAGYVLGESQQTAASYAESVTACLEYYDVLSEAARNIYKEKFSNEVFMANVLRYFRSDCIGSTVGLQSNSQRRY